MKGTEILFDPPFIEVEGMLNRLVTVIVESGHNLPRVGFALLTQYTRNNIHWCVGLIHRIANLRC